MKHTKYIVSPLRFFLLFAVFFLFSAQFTWAEVISTMPSDYYSAANGKKGEELRTALCGIISGHTVVSYDDLRYLYKYSDTYNAAGTTIEDIYSTCDAAYTTSFCSGDCGGYNREHSVPKSWFNEATPLYSDAFHLYATNCYVNSQRGNNAYGVCASGTACTTSGVAGKALGRSGTSTFVADNGNNYEGMATVFEPDDKYKGDLARTYFYMVTRYRTQKFTYADGGVYMFTYENGIAQLSQYSIDLLLKWHREDPVSEKELIRNEVIYGNTAYNKGSYKQGNRNPFIDYPCLAEYIWGDRQTETVDFDQLISGYTTVGTDGCPCAGPTITSPTGTINIGTTNTSTSIYKDITIQGVNLESGNLTLSIAGTNSAYFSLSATSVSKTNAEAGYNVTITYTPTANGSHTATLNINGCGLTSTHTVTLTGTCTTVYTATWMADGSSFGTSTAASGASPELPATNPSNCTSSRVFVGWTATSGYTGNSAPADLFTTTAPTITGNKNFYAVYADATTSGSGSVSTTVSMSTFTTVSGNVDGDSNVSYAATQGDAANAPAINSNVIRIYQNGGLLTITANNGKKLTSITIGSSMATTVTYAIDGGSVSSNQSILANGTYTLNSINANSVVFTCKGTDKNSRLYLNALSVTYSGSGSTTTYDNYSTTCSTGPTVTVTFHANGGTGTMPAQTIPQSTNTTLSTNTFTREGYSFAGWATTSSGTKVYDDGGTINTSSNIDLYAKWTALPTYTVTFNNNGATYATRSGYTGQTMSAVSDPEPCDGYTFEGWSINQYTADNTATPALITPTSIPASNTTYYAVFSKTEGTGSPVLTNNYKKITTTAELTDGNYIIASSTHALKNAVTSNGYYLQEGTVTISSDVITSTDASIIWQIQKSGTSNYTIYNSNVNKYVYVWTNVSGSKTYYELGLTTETKTFTAAYTSSKWQFKSTDYTSYMICYRGASYAYFNPYTSQSEALDLYKQQTEISSTTYHTTSPACACTYTITATTDDSSQGTVSVTTP